MKNRETGSLLLFSRFGSPSGAKRNPRRSAALIAFVMLGSAVSACAQTLPASRIVDQTQAGRPPLWPPNRLLIEKMAKENPTYSTAVFLHRDPHEYLAEKEGEIGKHAADGFVEAVAAKAALEAGEKEKARDYAVQALSAADAYAANLKHIGLFPDRPRSFIGIPYVDYYANFVLGRLAILDGDVRSAEQYLLAAGRTYGWSIPTFPHGPNLSLALEVLKHGDDQSRRVVVEFLDEISRWWLVPDPPFREHCCPRQGRRG